jgi:hypothetical protein
MRSSRRWCSRRASGSSAGIPRQRSSRSTLENSLAIARSSAAIILPESDQTHKAFVTLAGRFKCPNAEVLRRTPLRIGLRGIPNHGEISQHPNEFRSRCGPQTRSPPPQRLSTPPWCRRGRLLNRNVHRVRHHTADRQHDARHAASDQRRRQQDVRLIEARHVGLPT